MRWHGGNALAIRRAGHVILVVGIPTAAHAQSTARGIFENVDLGTIVLLALLIGAVAFTVFATIQLVRSRNRSEAENTQLRILIGDLRAIADRAEALVNEEDQRLVAWSGPNESPLLAGHLPSDSGVPADSSVFLDFPAWLKPNSASRLDQLSNT